MTSTASDLFLVGHGVAQLIVAQMNTGAREKPGEAEGPGAKDS